VLEKLKAFAPGIDISMVISISRYMVTQVAELLEKQRTLIAARVRELRQSRKWTQAELAKHLHVSQNRLSEIERGAGSFTAEQFLLILKLFNVATSHFVSGARAPDLELHNALARFGAVHLHENTVIVPSENLDEIHHVIREALLDGDPRVITALAPVLIRNSKQINLNRLHAELLELGRERRLAWVVENTLEALRQLAQIPGTRASHLTQLSRRAQAPLEFFLQYVSSDSGPARPRAPDILDTTIRSKHTLAEVQRDASEISRRWGIVTSLHPEDFIDALRQADGPG
jgi:transcriptional regulator with XRE-family HTH domain